MEQENMLATPPVKESQAPLAAKETVGQIQQEIFKNTERLRQEPGYQEEINTRLAKALENP
jgi:hypothetical protein